MEANTKHLLKWWIGAAILGGLVLVRTIAEVGRGAYTPTIALLVIIAIVAFGVRQARRRIVLLYREPNPDRAISYFRSSTRLVPNGKAMAAYLSAFPAVLYGQFDRARGELASVNWTALPPMYQGFEAHIHSLLAIFEAKDYSRALKLAEEARDLCNVSDKFPGSKTSRVALDANVLVCELLVGKNDSGLLDRLDRATKELPGVYPAIAAWALAAYHNKIGQQAAAAGYVAIVKRLVPHCTPLNDLRLDTRT